jgi:hypothetical protein
MNGMNLADPRVVILVTVAGELIVAVRLLSGRLLDMDIVSVYDPMAPEEGTWDEGKGGVK